MIAGIAADRPDVREELERRAGETRAAGDIRKAEYFDDIVAQCNELRQQNGTARPPIPAPAKPHGSDFAQSMRQGMAAMPDESRVAVQGGLAR